MAINDEITVSRGSGCYATVWVGDTIYQMVPHGIADHLELLETAYHQEIEARCNSIDRLRADSRRLDELLDPEGPFRVVKLDNPSFIESTTTTRLRTRDEIDEVLGEEPDDVER